MHNRCQKFRVCKTNSIPQDISQLHFLSFANKKTGISLLSKNTIHVVELDHRCVQLWKAVLLVKKRYHWHCHLVEIGVKNERNVLPV